MSKNLNFKPGYYKITKLIGPNVLEVEDTWFIKLKGVGDHSPAEELKKWLKEESIIKIIPYKRGNDARIISDVWLGNTHINRQFPKYKSDNFIQAFEEWDHNRSDDALLARETAEELIKAFYMAKNLISPELESSFNNWLESCLPQKRIRYIPPSVGEIIEKRQEALKRMTKDFNEWKEKQHG